MKGEIVVEVIRAVLAVVDRAQAGDIDAAKKLKEFLPHQTYLSVVRSAEAAKDEGKFGGRGESDGS